MSQPGILASEDELTRRAEAARVRAILEPQDEEARENLRRSQREREERHAAEADRQKTQRLAVLLLVALLSTAALAAARWLMS